MPTPRLVKASPICKTDAAKRIALGVVLDPYVIDLQKDWVPPNEVEEGCHQWTGAWRVIGAQHEKISKGSVLVESAVLPYPTREDYEAACALKPHRIWEMPFGDDVLHSGAWWIGVRYDDDDEWAKVISGEYSGFSIRGFGARIETTPRVMPEVTVIRLADLLTTEGA
jgi:hypothetical protein